MQHRLAEKGVVKRAVLFIIGYSDEERTPSSSDPETDENSHPVRQRSGASSVNNNTHGKLAISFHTEVQHTMTWRSQV